MRWLARYPITADEVLATLQRIPLINPPGTPIEQIRLGNVEDMVRKGIIDFFAEPQNMAALLSSMRRA